MEDNLLNWAKKNRMESLNMIHYSPAGHPGGALSTAEILAVLYFAELSTNHWRGQMQVPLV